MDWSQFIERDPDIAVGKPIIKGTRITVEFILERLSQGAHQDDLIEDIVGNET